MQGKAELVIEHAKQGHLGQRVPSGQRLKQEVIGKFRFGQFQKPGQLFFRASMSMLYVSSWVKPIGWGQMRSEPAEVDHLAGDEVALRRQEKVGDMADVIEAAQALDRLLL